MKENTGNNLNVSQKMSYFFLNAIFVDLTGMHLLISGGCFLCAYVKGSQTKKQGAKWDKYILICLCVSKMALEGHTRNCNSDCLALRDSKVGGRR